MKTTHLAVTNQKEAHIYLHIPYTHIKQSRCKCKRNLLGIKRVTTNKNNPSERHKNYECVGT